MEKQIPALVGLGVFAILLVVNQHNGPSRPSEPDSSPTMCSAALAAWQASKWSRESSREPFCSRVDGRMIRIKTLSTQDVLDDPTIGRVYFDGDPIRVARVCWGSGGLADGREAYECERR
jgi:hypothetical protein